MIQRNLPFSPNAPWLAPLAGWSDLPFRLLCRQLGAAVCCTEMISAKGLLYQSSGTMPLLQTCLDDSPLVVQLFGSEASCMGEAASKLKESGFSFFDCNMGCSVPKVAKTGSGSAMMRHPENAFRVAEALIAAAGRKKVGFKMRLGWDGSSENWLEIARTLEQLGAGWITLHPRTAVQGFSGIAKRQALRELKQALRIPVIASGDLFFAQDGLSCIYETGVDTVMYARGALNDPRIFMAHRSLLSGISCKPVPNTLDLIRKHVSLMKTFSAETVSLLKLRTVIPRYIRDSEGSKQLRMRVIQCSDWEELETILLEYEDFLGSCHTT
ncbi:MAG: tRNA-dihydrouridine synthase family protein [Desulfovibrionaceae bacterium]|nr:tRNA-dihydrouridine synthase family protein [Desulfovibrionaceae bacterium]